MGLPWTMPAAPAFRPSGPLAGIACSGNMGNMGTLPMFLLLLCLVLGFVLSRTTALVRARHTADEGLQAGDKTRPAGRAASVRALTDPRGQLFVALPGITEPLAPALQP